MVTPISGAFGDDQLLARVVDLVRRAGMTIFHHQAEPGVSLRIVDLRKGPFILGASATRLSLPVPTDCAMPFSVN